MLLKLGGLQTNQRPVLNEEDAIKADFDVASDEIEAVRRCQKGDADAFRLIVERYGALLHGTAYLMLHDRGQAEDAVQEAFVSAWRGIGTFSTMSSLRPWLLRIVVNQVLQRKRRKLFSFVPFPESGPAVTSTDAGPELAAEKSWEQDEIRKALDALPEKDARIVILRFFAELSLTEVAAALEIPEGTVKSRLHRALQKLQKQLVGRHIRPTDHNESPDEAQL